MLSLCNAPMAGVGEYLEEARKKAGLTLEQVYQTTRIQVWVLQALEEERFEEIGTPAQVRGFIRAYCKALHVDDTVPLEAFSKLLKGKPQNQISLSSAPVLPVIRTSEETRQNFAYVALVALLLIGLIVTILTIGSSSNMQDVSKVQDLPKIERLNEPKQNRDTRGVELPQSLVSPLSRHLTS